MGGVICGNCAIGSFCKDTRPSTTMMMDRTEAKIGRSIKKWELMVRSAWVFPPDDYLESFHPGMGQRSPEPLVEPDGSPPPPPVLLAGGHRRSTTRFRTINLPEPGEAPPCHLRRSHRQTIR